MESASTILALSMPFFTISKALRRHFIINNTRSLLHSSQLVTRWFSSNYSRDCKTSPLRGLCSVLPLLRRRLEFVSSSASSFGTPDGFGCGSGSSGGEFGGGGGGGSGGGDAESNPVAGGASAEEVSVLSSDVIILDVRGMTCGGCAASVKRTLECQPQVSSASVNLTTETAIVWPVSEVKVTPNWQKQLGEELAKHLTNCGFMSNFRDA